MDIQNLCLKYYYDPFPKWTSERNQLLFAQIKKIQFMANIINKERFVKYCKELIPNSLEEQCIEILWCSILNDDTFTVFEFFKRKTAVTKERLSALFNPKT